MANSSFGKVILDKKGIQSSKQHGMSRIKASAFAAVKDVLEKGFVMPRFTDGIRVIWYGETETFYRFVLFVFYMLGCFQVRFYQYEVRYSNFFVGRETRRFVSFHSIVWNPISILSDIVLDIMNLFYAKIMPEIKVSPRITIDVKDNRAYIIHIRM